MCDDSKEMDREAVERMLFEGIIKGNPNPPKREQPVHKPECGKDKCTGCLRCREPAFRIWVLQLRMAMNEDGECKEWEKGKENE